MADEGIFATTAEIVRKAGAQASSVSTAEAYTNDFVAQAESTINAETKVNWSDIYATLDEDLRDILKLAASNLAAIYVISYDTRGFRTAADAQTALDVLWAGYRDAIRILTLKHIGKFIGAPE